MRTLKRRTWGGTFRFPSCPAASGPKPHLRGVLQLLQRQRVYVVQLLHAKHVDDAQPPLAQVVHHMQVQVALRALAQEVNLKGNEVLGSKIDLYDGGGWGEREAVAGGH